jgi:antitoxin component of RelBE/YafQ-DinJ toxin-antitoxin module
MARKPLINTRVERDTKEAFDAYADSLDDDDVSDSEVARHLLRAGLATKGYPVGTTTIEEPDSDDADDADDANDDEPELTTRAFGQAFSLQTTWRLGVLVALIILVVTEVGI